ncbi:MULTISPECIES: hypothetical protein [Nostoc]|uniref:Lipoprotein n=2 Tax=Nostoc TaxID=1177 RepID=A0ABR8IB93_9NOSO|nr:MULTISPECIES: hypothetical protein [Nostoc]MBD2563069.1 hypothetical protein [Nostoc linckia FACHB-391]MBD2648154.1 hypothetical protein [Nostoc foliaceum FACHB-393]
MKKVRKISTFPLILLLFVLQTACSRLSSQQLDSGIQKSPDHRNQSHDPTTQISSEPSESRQNSQQEYSYDSEEVNEASNISELPGNWTLLANNDTEQAGFWVEVDSIKRSGSTVIVKTLFKNPQQGYTQLLRFDCEFYIVRLLATNGEQPDPYHQPEAYASIGEKIQPGTFVDKLYQSVCRK